MAKYSSTDLLTTALYNPENTNVKLFLDNYIELLRNRGSENDITHANRLQQYSIERCEEDILEYQNYATNLRAEIKNNYPHLHSILFGRIKSAISIDKKIVKNINEGKSLDRIRDTFAFRLILFSDKFTEMELINACYVLMNFVIEYTGKNYILCDAEPVQATSIDTSIFPDIIIPKKSLIHPKYQDSVKDYICHPKANSYQSLHTVFRFLIGGKHFEFQIRTLEMHKRAESGDAEWSSYKKRKYSSSLKIDRSLVHISGYGYDHNGKPFDWVGLEEGLPIFISPTI